MGSSASVTLIAMTPDLYRCEESNDHGTKVSCGRTILIRHVQVVNGPLPGFGPIPTGRNGLKWTNRSVMSLT